MNTSRFTNHLKGTFIIPAGLAVVGIPFSLFIGWNLLSLVMFWIVVVSALALYLPTKVSRNRNHLTESLTGLLVFYGIMVYGIYDHYQSDYFKLMMVSCGVNLMIITLVSLTKKTKAAPAQERPTQQSPPTQAIAVSLHQSAKPMR